MFPEWYQSSFSRAVLLALLVVMPPRFGIASEASLPPLLQEVQAQYQKSAGIQAEFTQSTEIRATRQTKKAQGRIWIKRPGKLRWETLEPDPNILVSDGKVYWFYTPPFDTGERGQVIIRKKSQVQTQFLNGLLSGTFEFGKGAVAITEKAKNIFLLKPRVGTAGDVSVAEVEIETIKKMISRVTLTHTSGNTTRIELQEISLASKLEDSLFRFTIDKNTDKIVE
ncbi:MAG: outer membrane lipoprotein chaperone LolA [Bdellovibrionales bacterium]|nr:outer membrane lipoprotein chaperone LolA [Bdellovibrionales bacterium]